ncbi:MULTISPECIES: SapB/AmfS family lanthipeptide [Amycolatopsis]|uniref:SapB/AmfS family lanthipeptide n=1 Tax=Amycolatopsis rhabdoformis TaxID=1448059 RepID=A0ABZ1I4C0_9PSEU|nr:MULTISPECIES: SapB/AmfS family lanthipeptide [Amycolatopsis]QYN24563.1 SapB/AmfS family lanthipeptide [Amycolatopsis sp. DSM 110486]WSE28791.1 SapB/AmfS family lanthipeptide [Amycolatopsis rhabdoformis]
MELVLDLQALEAPEALEGHGGGHGHGHGAPSNLSLLASCAHSTLSLLTCH